MLVYPLHIPPDRLCAHGHGPVDPGPDLYGPAAGGIASKTGRYLDGEADITGAHALVQLGVVADRGMLVEVVGAGQAVGVIAAQGGPIVVEPGKGDVFHVHVDAVAEHEHEDDAAQCGHREPDGITTQLDRLAP